MVRMNLLKDEMRFGLPTSIHAFCQHCWSNSSDASMDFYQCWQKGEEETWNTRTLYLTQANRLFWVDLICWSDLYQIRSMGSNTELDMPSILKASEIRSGSEKEKLVKSQSSWLMVHLAVCELLLLDYDHYNMLVRPICILYRIANTSADRHHLSAISKDF